MELAGWSQNQSATSHVDIVSNSFGPAHRSIYNRREALQPLIELPMLALPAKLCIPFYLHSPYTANSQGKASVFFFVAAARLWGK